MALHDDTAGNVEQAFTSHPMVLRSSSVLVTNVV